MPHPVPEQLWVRAKAVGDQDGIRSLAIVQADEAEQTVHVRGSEWNWIGFDLSTAGPASGHVMLTGRGQGLAVDRVVFTTRGQAAPTGLGWDQPTTAPVAPAAPQGERIGSFEIQLTWDEVNDPVFSHYQVYRGREGRVAPTQRHLVGSPSDTTFIDYSLEPGVEYTYLITAVDDWSNESAPSPQVTIQTRALGNHVIKRHDLNEPVHLNAQAVEITFDLPVDDAYVIWLRAETSDRNQAPYRYQVNDGQPTGTLFLGPAPQAGQAEYERLQWHRVFTHRRDAGTLFNLKSGRHTVRLTAVEGTRPSPIVGGVIITNDRSYIPPGERWFY